MTTLTVVLTVAMSVLIWPARGLRWRAPAGRSDVDSTLPGGCQTASPAWSAPLRGHRGGLGDAFARLGQRARRGEGADDVVEFVELLALSLRSGLPPTEAIEIAAQGQGDAARDVRALAGLLASQLQPGSGAPADGSLPSQLQPGWVAPEGVSATTGAASADWALLGAAWTLSLERGSPLTEAVETSAAALRARQASQRRALAARAGPRASMWLLTALPVAGPLAALLVGVDPGTTFGNPLAIASLLVGLGLTAAGWWWGSRLIRRAQMQPAWS